MTRRVTRLEFQLEAKDKGFEYVLDYAGRESRQGCIIDRWRRVYPLH